ncbi:o-succinylbenzoate--CoA ligase [Nakamurella deserti]|uniref:o-succinylbenzoate--CoA ligase n=1 Tax=Nakamurella deserti TaxID=2164074 RepID=UPI000DBE9EBF|nr:o-succinylbenzoate--CoA ligase [Nakamurella deserti]
MIDTVVVPTGAAVLALLPRLAAALDGAGPALRPVTADTALPPADEVPGLALVVATSGSTGDPKQVLLTADALRHSATAGQRRLSPGDPGQWLLTLPVHHIAGLNVLLRAVVAGREPVVMDTAAPFTAAAFADATDRLDGPAFVSLVPTQLHRLLGDPAGTAALRRFTAVLVGGAATAPALLDRARAAGVAVVTSYGMSETCGGCVYDGRPLDGVSVSLGPGGRIVLTGPVVGVGYAGRPPFPSGRFVTGDLGTIADGRLTVLGRADDVLISGGVNVAPQAVEAALAGAPGVGQIAVTGVPDPEWGTRIVAVVVPAEPGPLLADLRARATAVVGAAAAPKDLLLVDVLPLLPVGKVDRVALARLARAAVG